MINLKKIRIGYKTKRWLKFFILVIVLILFFLLITHTDSINNILNNPSIYQGKNVTIFGKMLIKNVTKDNQSIKETFLRDKENNSIKIISKEGVNINRLENKKFIELKGNIEVEKDEVLLEVTEIKDDTSFLFKIKKYLIVNLSFGFLILFLIFIYFLFNFRRLKSKKWFRNLGNFKILPFVCSLALIFVLFQPAFGYYLGEFSVSADGPKQIDFIKSILKNPNQVKFGKVKEGISTTNVYLMIFSLVLAILAFLLASFGFWSTGLARFAAILSFLYAGLNYMIITQLNSQLGLLRGVGGASFGLSGIIALIVGGIYFYLGR